MFQTIQRYGLMQGIFLFVAIFASYFLFGDSPENYGKGEIYGYSMMILSCTAIFFAAKHYRDKYNNGVIGFLPCAGLGIGVSAVAGAIFALYNWVYLTWLNPNFLVEYQAWHEAQIRSSGLPQADIEKQLSELAQSADMMQSMPVMLVVMFLTVFFIGVLFSLVTAAALRTNEAQTQSA